MILFIMLHQVVSTFKFVDVIIQMKAIKQYFHVLFIMLYDVVLQVIFKCVDETLV